MAAAGKGSNGHEAKASPDASAKDKSAGMSVIEAMARGF
jgi:hypothetical protein